MDDVKNEVSRGSRVIVRVEGNKTRAGFVIRESQDRGKKCWWIRLDGRKTPWAYHKSFVFHEPEGWG